MGEGTKEQASRIAELLKDSDWNVRAAAASALGAMGEGAKEQAPRVAELLKDSDQRVQFVAARALGAMGEGAKEQAPRVAELLKDPDSDVQNAAAKALESMAPLHSAAVVTSFAKILEDRGARARWMVHAHIVGRGDELIERVLRWVGRTSDEKPTSLTIEEARATLNAFLEFWPHAARYRILEDALAENIALVADLNRGDWAGLEDLRLLAKHVDNLRKAHPVQAGAVQGVITAHTYWRWLSRARWAVIAHLSLWLLLIFAYPYFPKVQAIFFWHPWVRRFMGFGYVGLLLVLVPFLRQRLLSPFREQLLADANLDGFSADGYFSRSEVLVARPVERKRLLDALPELKGKVILEGASGLGKSMFLKYLLSRSKRLAVYLPAERCNASVLDAIQAKLEGIAGDAHFLKSVIHSGALDIYIDGLNEVTADTRARIIDFVDRNFQGNILLATQPIEWKPPAAARLYVLQPLSDAEVVNFLAGREPLLGDSVKLRGVAYIEKCKRFVEEALSPQQSEFLRQAMREVLSNPMDLTVVAQMLANDQMPDLSNLRQQQYELMAKGYLEIVGTEFPLARFCEEAYQMRVEGRSSLDEARFGKELLRLEDARMVLRRRWRGPDGKDCQEWRFRHDKIQEFFIAQTFLPADSQRDTRHMEDSRFRGVYLLLVSLLPLDRARVLRDVLVERAAETRDHSVSDDFVKLLKVREAAEKARREAASGAGAAVLPLHHQA
jgi:hypothetical protein